ncbi:MAG: phosphatase PAP2 family protein [Bacilli bacterium]|nr:phosphatase PAP2 family protein [Bacilli bacterium]
MKNRYLFIPAGVVVLTLLIVGSLCDLTIAQGIYWADNGFSHFMAGFAMMPLGALIGFILGTLFKMVTNHQYKKKWQNILLVFISFAGLVCGLYVIGMQVTSYHAYNLHKAYSFLFGALSLVPGYLLGYFFYEKVNNKNLIKTYILIAVSVGFMIAFIETTKIIFPRLRYTSIVQLGNNSLFRPWYLTDFSLNKQFVIEHKLVDNEEIKSFPSGHSQAALATAFVMMFIPKLFPKFKGKEVYFFYGGFLYFLIVALSRMLIGAHYLSDTMFAGTVALLVYFTSNEIYLRKIYKE